MEKDAQAGVLNARSATIIFVVVFAAEMAGAFLLDMATGFAGSANVGKIADVCLTVIGGGVMVFLAFILIPTEIKATTPTGAAWVWGKWENIFKGFAVGILISSCSLILDAIDQPHLAFKNLTPIQQMSLTPGFQQFIGMIATILIGPPIEEMMYRGILYGGYRKSFGPMWAALLTTALFVAIHFYYFIPFPYKVIPIAISALGFLWCRLQWKAIGPAIAAHMGFNFMINLATLYDVWHK